MLPVCSPDSKLEKLNVQTHQFARFLGTCKCKWQNNDCTCNNDIFQNDINQTNLLCSPNRGEITVVSITRIEIITYYLQTNCVNLEERAFLSNMLSNNMLLRGWYSSKVTPCKPDREKLVQLQKGMRCLQNPKPILLDCKRIFRDSLKLKVEVWRKKCSVSCQIQGLTRDQFYEKNLLLKVFFYQSSRTFW